MTARRRAWTSNNQLTNPVMTRIGLARFAYRRVLPVGKERMICAAAGRSRETAMTSAVPQDLFAVSDDSERPIAATKSEVIAVPPMIGPSIEYSLLNIVHGVVDSR